MKVTESGCDHEIVEIARRMYKAYIANSDGKSWDGRPCPAWADLTPAVRSHWCAAALEGAKELAERIREERARVTTRLKSFDVTDDESKTAPAPAPAPALAPNGLLVATAPTPAPTRPPIATALPGPDEPKKPQTPRPPASQK